MALVKCPECGREICDRAAACPQCGCPMAAPAPPPVQPGWNAGKIRDAIKQDIQAAEYGSNREFLGIKVPIVGKSVSGWLCVGIGGLLGGAVVFSLFMKMFGENNGSNRTLIKFAIMLAVLGGTWVGVQVHRAIRDTVT